jgi:chemotaxis protein CheC
MQLTDMQLDALRELANIGSGNAATSLSKMLGRSIDVAVPDAQMLPLADAVDAAGPADAYVTAVLLPVFGDLDALVLLLFSPEDAATLCGLLGVDREDELGLSALAEIGNILGSSYIGALGVMSGLSLEPRPPQTASDMLGAIVATVVSSIAGDADAVLYIDSGLVVEQSECSFSFLLVPTTAGVRELLVRLGLGE